MRRHASLNLCTDRYRDPPKNHFFNTIGQKRSFALTAGLSALQTKAEFKLRHHRPAVVVILAGERSTAGLEGFAPRREQQPRQALATLTGWRRAADWTIASNTATPCST